MNDPTSRTWPAVALAFLFLTLPSLAKEASVSLARYATTAEAICLCTVDRDNGDRTVTIRTDLVLKGELDATEVVHGDTGHCVLQGPASRFMKPGERYVVFLFAGNTVGRLGGIIPVRDGTLHARFVDGFAGGEFDRKEWALKLPLEKALAQIRALLEEGGVQKENE